jgi:2'-5' RNA ligase
MGEQQMRANDLHLNGTYAELVPDSTTRAMLSNLATKLGIANITPYDKFHTTLIYSKKPCPDMQDLDGTPFPHSARIVGLETWDTQQGTRCLVALVKCPEAIALHHSLREQHGATHDYPNYQPHFTLSYDCGDGDLTLPPGEHTVRYERLHVKPLDPKWSA